MRLGDIVETSQRVSAASARLEKIALLAATIQRLPRPLAGVGVGYLMGELPQGRLGVGYARLRALWDGPAAAEATLELVEVHRALDELKAIAGSGSNERRARALGALLARATAGERAFLLRLLVGELRQGALEGVVAEAVARAFSVPAPAVRRAAMLAGALPPVAEALAEAGAPGLERFQLQLFAPVQPMLADTAPDVETALSWLPQGDVGLEYKLDGARVQVHKDGARVEVYSRALNVVTPAVPELVELVAALPARRLVLDGEAIAFAAGAAGAPPRPLPFQVTMRRFGRRLDVAGLRRQLPLHAYFFDLLRLDDQTLIDHPLGERWRALAEATGGVALVPRLVTGDRAAAEAFSQQALAEGHEGVMAKALGSPYAAGRRGQEWLKLKPAHTLDLVVLAAEWGSGRRRGWLSNLHLGARDPEAGGFVMLGKTFKGMTDEILRWQTQALRERAIGDEAQDEAHVVHVRPELVVEIAFNDVQSSPHYPGGVALRFARLKRYRPDKRPEDADTIATVRALLPPGV
jgi:DNA ligase 1